MSLLIKCLSGFHVLIRKLKPKDRQKLLEIFGFPDLRPHQSAAAGVMLAGRDLVLLVQTSGGKTEAVLAAYFLLKGRGVHLQIEPLKALQADMRERLTKLGLRVVVLNSDLAGKARTRAFRDIREGKIDCVLTTPEQLEKPEVFACLDEVAVKTMAVDEAHCVLEYGGDFRPAYNNIGFFVNRLKHRPVVAACTATLAPDGLGRVAKSLGLKDPVIIRSSIDRPEIRLNTVEIGSELGRNDVDLVEKERFRRLRKSIDKYGQDGGTIVYCTYIDQTKKIAAKLKKCGCRVEPFYADMGEREKEKVRQRFKQGTLPIVVATSAFGMGVDKPDVRLIVHMSLPLSVEDFWQKTGRAGRDGKESVAVMLWYRGDAQKNINLLKQDLKKTWKLKDFVKLLNTPACRVQQIREYFGQARGKPCGNCDYCKSRK